MRALKENSRSLHDDGVIQVHLDRTDFQKVFYLEKNLLKAYQRFSEKLISACGRSSGAYKSPLAVEALSFEQKESILSGFVLR